MFYLKLSTTESYELKWEKSIEGYLNALIKSVRVIDMTVELRRGYP